MHIERLQITRVRNLKNITIYPGKQKNFLIGRNASGKTAILESIYLLARGKSFRTPKIREVIQHGEEKLIITAKIQHEKEGSIKTGIEKKHGHVVIKRDGEKLKTTSQQAKRTPIVLVTQETQAILTGTPKQRRNWLDWAMFHVEQDYLKNWKKYMRAMRHRNILLKKKEKNPKTYRGWEEAMVESAHSITEQRERFLQAIQKHVKREKDQGIIRDTEIYLKKGWPENKNFLSALEESRKKEMEKGYTNIGIHQAEVVVEAQKKQITTTYSRGQIKLYAIFLLLAEAKEIERKTGVKPIVIMDDFKAEIDEAGSEQILTWLKKEEFQSFLATTSFKKDKKEAKQGQWFHVEQGEATKEIKG